MLVHGIPEPARDAVDRALEPEIAEGLDLPAVAADEMVVMIAVGGGRLKTRDPVSGIDAFDETQLDQSLESPIDRGNSDRPAGPAQLVVDLLGAQAAVLASE